MKKFKRIVVSALAVVMLVGMMAVPASAVRDVNYEGHDNGSGTGYYWTSNLSISGQTVKASITVTANGSGYVPPTLSAELSGTIYTTEYTYSLYKTAEGTHTTEITAYDTYTVTGYKVVGAKCTYKAQGLAAGDGLTLGETF